MKKQITKQGEREECRDEKLEGTKYTKRKRKKNKEKEKKGRMQMKRKMKEMLNKQLQ